jgi:hypothetical protein
MPAAATRPTVERHRRADNLSITPHLVADHTGLLDALPIAAAVIECAGDSFKVAAHNSRFVDLVKRSNCTALDWNEAQCLKSGPIADLLGDFFDGEDVAGELDFTDGDGVSAQFYRIKLAPLPKNGSRSARCLLSVVDRTVELQAERTLRAEMLRDSLTGLPNRLAFSEAIESAGDKVARDL